MKKALIAVFCIALVASLSSSCLAKMQPVKVLFLVNGCCHDFKALPAMLAKTMESNGEFKVFISEDRNELIPANIKKYDLALFYTQGSDMTPEQEKGLTEFVASGKGYAGIHCASDSFKNSDGYFKLVGGRFSGHGSGTFTVKVTNRRNEILKGLDKFDIKDETYDHKFHPDSKLVILARRDKDGAPAVWIQNYGKGRMFFTGLGHGKEAFENPAFEQVMIRGMRWAAGIPLDGPGGKSESCK